MLSEEEWTKLVSSEKTARALLKKITDLVNEVYVHPLLFPFLFGLFPHDIRELVNKEGELKEEEVLDLILRLFKDMQCKEKGEKNG